MGWRGNRKELTRSGAHSPPVASPPSPSVTAPTTAAPSAVCRDGGDRRRRHHHPAASPPPPPRAAAHADPTPAADADAQSAEEPRESHPGHAAGRATRGGTPPRLPPPPPPTPYKIRVQHIDQQLTV